MLVQYRALKLYKQLNAHLLQACQCNFACMGCKERRASLNAVFFFFFFIVFLMVASYGQTIKRRQKKHDQFISGENVFLQNFIVVHKLSFVRRPVSFFGYSLNTNYWVQWQSDYWTSVPDKI